jgi:predicted nucleic acid-binding protein
MMTRSYLANFLGWDNRIFTTDCISMQVMRREGLTEVLTNDHHFTQEGFHSRFP